MSLELRRALVAHENTLFRSDTQRADLLDPSKTKTGLVALLWDIVGRGHILEFTAIKTDHHNDSALGIHSHAWGQAADVWANSGRTLGAYLDAGDPAFHAFLMDARVSKYLWQVGLAGSADTTENHTFAGPTSFTDYGGDHVHLGAIIV